MTVRKVLWTYKPNKDGSCMVRIYAYHQGRKKYFHTGLSVNPSDWNEKTLEVKKSHPLATRYNAKINRAKLDIEAHLLDGGTFEDMDKGNGSFLEYLEAFLQDANKDLAETTLKAYKGMRTRIREYLAATGREDILFRDFIEGWDRQYIDFLKARGICKEIGAANHIKVIKKLLRKAQNEGLHKNESYQEYKVYKSKGSDKIYLSEKEIQRLERLDLSDQRALEQERDRWLLAYYFLLRFSDVIRITAGMIVKHAGKEYLSMKHKKTGISVVVPVNSKARAILEKYNYDFSYTSNQQANRRLKTICALAGINDQAQEGGRTAQKSQFVGTHTARRSAATNLCLQGVSLKFIADLGGWKEISTLRIYLRQSGIDTAIMASDIEFFR